MIEFHFIEASRDDNENRVSRVIAELLDWCAAELIEQDSRDAPENSQGIAAQAG